MTPLIFIGVPPVKLWSTDVVTVTTWPGVAPSPDSISVILSGGLNSIEDIKKLKTNENSIFKGAIIGKALYEKKIDPIEALKIINSEGL